MRQGWRSAQGGGVAVAFAVALPVLALAVGGGVDLSNALSYRQTLASALELGCQQSALEINYQIAQNNASAGADFSSTVNRITAQKLDDANIDSTAKATSTTKSNTITISGTGASATAFPGIVGRSGYPVTLQRTCLYQQANQQPPTGQTLFSESFEVNHTVAQNSWTVLAYNGKRTSGATWNGWSTLNAGIEINGMPQLSGGSIRFGNFFAELDSDCLGASPCHSNSTMYRTVTLQAGQMYEVNYWYISRVTDSNYKSYNISAPSGYGSTPICSLVTDTDGMSKVNAATWDGQTNRIELSVEPESQTSFTSSTTRDICIYATEWTQRSYTFTPTKTESWRFSWRAAGKEDTFGGLIDYLRLCAGRCP